MLPRKVQVKLYAQEAKDASLDSYIPAFHRFIQQSSLDELLIDVTDYGHVPHGPGVLLVGHGSDYYLDESEGRPGLLYARKRDLPPGANLVEDALRRALRAAELLDADTKITGPRLFGTDELLFRFPDRLMVQNNSAGFEAVEGMLRAALSEVFPGKSFALSREDESRAPLTVRARA